MQAPKQKKTSETAETLNHEEQQIQTKRNKRSNKPTYKHKVLTITPKYRNNLTETNQQTGKTGTQAHTNT